MSTTETWLVKLKRTGFETVLSSASSESAAWCIADVLNGKYQTDEYYIEKRQAELSSWPSREDARFAAGTIRATISGREATE